MLGLPKHDIGEQTSSPPSGVSRKAKISGRREELNRDAESHFADDKAPHSNSSNSPLSLALNSLTVESSRSTSKYGSGKLELIIRSSAPLSSSSMDIISSKLSSV